MKKELFISKIILTCSAALIAFGGLCLVDRLVNSSDYASWYAAIHREGQIPSPYFESALIDEEIAIGDDGQSTIQYFWYYTDRNLRQIHAACEESGADWVVLGQHTCIGGSLTRITIDRQTLQILMDKIAVEPTATESAATSLSYNHNLDYSDELPDLSDMLINVVGTKATPTKTGFFALAHGFILGLSQRLMLWTGCTVRTASAIMSIAPCLTASAICFGMAIFTRRQRNAHSPRFLNLSGSL